MVQKVEVNISINVFAVASRAQALQARWYLDLKQRYENGQYKSYSDTYSVVADIENRLKGLAGATGAGMIYHHLEPSTRLMNILKYLHNTLLINLKQMKNKMMVVV